MRYAGEIYADFSSLSVMDRVSVGAESIAVSKDKEEIISSWMIATRAPDESNKSIRYANLHSRSHSPLSDLVRVVCDILPPCIGDDLPTVNPLNVLSKWQRPPDDLFLIRAFGVRFFGCFDFNRVDIPPAK